MTLLRYKAIALDFDGVLVESNDIKTGAFRHVFAGYPEHWPKVLEYHRSTTVIRFEKFRHIYQHILKRPYTAEDEVRLGRAFSDFCIEAVIRCPQVKGAQAFLEHFAGRVPLYLVSINPAEDLNRILKGRGWDGFFKKIYTPRSSKAEALVDILRRENISAKQAVFIGDSGNDEQSARQAGVDYIDRNAFRDMEQILDMAMNMT